MNYKPLSREEMEMISIAPKEHPFALATLCENFCERGHITYFNKIKKMLYTYPEYDANNKCFSFDMMGYSAENIDTITIPLASLFESTKEIDKKVALEFCTPFGITPEEINALISSGNKKIAV